MFVYLLRRLIMLVPVLAVVAGLAFTLIFFSPGDPAIAILGTEATPDRVAQLREEMGLNRPFLIQFLDWVSRAIRGDLGRSYSLAMSVSEAIGQRLAPTASLAMVGYIIALMVGLPAGILAAIRRGSYVDQLVMGVSVLGLSLPSFVTGLLLILFFSVRLGWLPSGGYRPFLSDPLGSLQYLVLPGLAVGLFQAALIARITRSSMLEVMRQDYIRTARSKGLLESLVITRHALPNAFIPILTVMGMGFGSLLGGVVATETVFTYPGLGRLAVFAIQRRDYPLVLGVVVFLTAIYVLVNLVVDILYAMIDPRIRYE